MQSVTSKVEISEVAPGLWIWRAEHHHWKPGDDWQPIVTSTYVESGGQGYVLDPLVPKMATEELWRRLDSRPPTGAAVIIADHARDIDDLVSRYHVRAFGPSLILPAATHGPQGTRLLGVGLTLASRLSVQSGGECRTWVRNLFLILMVRSDNDLSSSTTFDKIPHCLSGLTKRVASIDHRHNFSSFHEFL